MILSKAIEGYIMDATMSLSPRTVVLYRLYLGMFQKYTGDPEVETITPHLLKTYLLYMQTQYVPNRPSGNKDKLGPSALDNHWKCLRSFFGWASEAIDLPRPDGALPRPRYKLPQPDPFSQDDVKKLLVASGMDESHSERSRKKFPPASSPGGQGQGAPAVLP